jgi:hypothetical protein
MVTPESVRKGWKIDQDRLQLSHEFKMLFVNPPHGGYALESTVTVESDPGALDPAQHPKWRVVGMELITASDTMNNSPMRMGSVGHSAEMMKKKAKAMKAAAGKAK